MGFQVLFDIIASITVGGVFLLTMLNYSGHDSEQKQKNRDQIVAQQNLIAVVDVLEEDFKQIGYCASRRAMSSPVVVIAESCYIAFKTDTPLSSGDGDGVPDTVSYRLGPPMLDSPNPHVCMLYRKVNAEPFVGSNMGVTNFRLRYLKWNGDSLALPIAQPQLKEITGIEVVIKVENLFPYMTYDRREMDSLMTYTPVNWKQLRFEIRNYGRGAI